MAGNSLLDHLRGASSVDCDTLDEAVARDLGPFVDCTSNQAIALGELKKPQHEALLVESAKIANELHEKFPDIPIEALAIEAAMVMLAIPMLPHISSVIHIQANPEYAYSKEQTVKAGLRILSIFSHVDKKVDRDRVCIKIPSTWEGLQACKELESQCVKTLATTLFCLEQAILAAEADCHYVAPYLHELKHMTVPGYRDNGATLDIVVHIQEYYKNHGQAKTQVLPAALDSPEECMSLAGAHHITIAPALLKQLSETPFDAQKFPSLFVNGPNYSSKDLTVQRSYIEDEAGYRLAITRSDGGHSEQKLTQALNVFSDSQESLVEILKVYIDKSR